MKNPKFRYPVAAAFRLRFAGMVTIPDAWCHPARRSLKAAATIAILAFFVGCEQTAPTDGLPYVNHIVIKGILVAGQPLDSISVSHTLPLSAQFDPYQAALPDAHVVITVDGRAIPLAYVGWGYFSDAANDTVTSGKTYHISVDWNGLHVEASTLVPQAPVVDSFTLADIRGDTTIYRYGGRSDSNFSFGGWLEAAVLPHGQEAYEITFDSMGAIGDTTIFYNGSGNNEIHIFVGNSLRRTSDALPDGRIWLKDWFWIYPESDSNFAISATISSFDAPYYDFLQTYSNSSNRGSVFGTGGANPKWNVTGDGIGMFIGMASTQVSKTVRR